MSELIKASGKPARTAPTPLQWIIGGFCLSIGWHTERMFSDAYGRLLAWVFG